MSEESIKLLESAKNLLRQAEEKVKQSSPEPAQSAALTAIGQALINILIRTKTKDGSIALWFRWV
jgi:hypothetical protein